MMPPSVRARRDTLTPTELRSPTPLPQGRRGDMFANGVDSRGTEGGFETRPHILLTRIYLMMPPFVRARKNTLTPTELRSPTPL